jgi:Tfp pilus assembly protein PilO
MKLPSNSNIFVTLFCITLAVGGWFLVVPKITQTVTEFSRLDLYTQATAQQDSLAAKATRERQLASYVDALMQRRNIVNPLLPAEENPVDLTIQIETLARSQGINLSALQVSPAAEAGARTTSAQANQAVVAVPGTKASNVAITVNGSYEQVRTFVLSLPSINRIIQLSDVTMSGSSGGVTATISAAAYIYPSAN